MSDSPPFQFGLSSLLLITTLVAVVMSMSVMAPPLGIAIGIVAVPAMIRTCTLVSRYQRANHDVSIRRWTLLFISCLCISWYIHLLACLASICGFVVGIVLTLGNLDLTICAAVLSGIVMLAVLFRRWFKDPSASFGVLRIPGVQFVDDHSAPLEP